MNNTTKGRNETWGSWASDALNIESPVGRGLMELTNPAYLPEMIYGGAKLYGNMSNMAKNVSSFAGETRNALRFNSNPVNKASKARMPYPWQRTAVPA